MRVSVETALRLLILGDVEVIVKGDVDTVVEENVDDCVVVTVVEENVDDGDVVLEENLDVDLVVVARHSAPEEYRLCKLLDRILSSGLPLTITSAILSAWMAI